MAAATDLFRERGFRETSLGDIGAAAGVSGPAIYRYFDSKGELLSVLIEEAAIIWRGTVDDVLNEDMPPMATLENCSSARRHRRWSCATAICADDVRQGVPLARRRRATARLARIERVTHGRVGAPAVRGSAPRPGRRGGAGRPCRTWSTGMLRSVTTPRPLEPRGRWAGWPRTWSSEDCSRSASPARRRLTRAPPPRPWSNRRRHDGRLHLHLRWFGLPPFGGGLAGRRRR